MDKVKKLGVIVEDHAVAAAQPPEFSDEALALRYADRHADGLRYVAKWGKWFRWIGHKWEDEDTLYAFDLARALCREESARANKSVTAKTVASAKTRAAVVSLAREDRRIAAVVGQWDVDPWLLNTPGGTINLRTGITHKHRPEDYITKSTAVTPGGDCPQWMQFLDRVTGGDSELQAYLQRAFGYSLTGSIEEHALLFCYGTGSNGKSTMMNTVSGILADYYASTSVETFTVSSGDKHPADLAALRGARLVLSSETEEGHRWAESRIKQLTGGDPIPARFMRQDWFTYIPQFKLFFAGNHKPRLRTVNEAIKRRMHLVPFKVVIPGSERDKTLPNKLRQEWPGILAWMVKGCLIWQQKGLAPPESVMQATDEYMRAEDVLGAWIEDCCVRDAQSWTDSHELFANWQDWAERTGQYVGSESWLVGKLEDAGFRRHRMNKGAQRNRRGLLGLRVRRQADGELPF